MGNKNNKKTVLLVEDEAMMREIVAHKLLQNDFEIIEAENGNEAVAMWEKNKPDLVLLDLMLPGLSGFEILKRIRNSKDKHVASTPVIVLSNLWSNENILQAENLKIQGYLVKAYFTTDDILKKVQEVLDKAEES